MAHSKEDIKEELDRLIDIFNSSIEIDNETYTLNVAPDDNGTPFGSGWFTIDIKLRIKMKRKK